MVSNHRFECGSTNLPPMKRLYRGWMGTCSVASREGAYSQRALEAGPGERRSRVSMADVVMGRTGMLNVECSMLNVQWAAHSTLDIQHSTFNIPPFNRW